MKVAMIVDHRPESPWIPDMKDRLPIGSLVIGDTKGGRLLPEDTLWLTSSNDFGWWLPLCNLEILGDL